MAKPKAGFDAYSETLMMRLKLVEADSPAIAEVYDSIACSYTEMGDVAKALEYIHKATKIHEAHDPKRMARTYAILAMTSLRAGNPDHALDALTNCWRLQGLTEDEVARSKYPKHSGDIVLLARIYHAQGKKKSALELASKSITIRKGILGNKGPRVADSMYIVSGLLREDGKEALAMKLLREIVEMSQGLVEMKGHLARALWTLAVLEEEVGNIDEAETLKKKAGEIRRKIVSDSEAFGEEEDSGEAYQKLVGYMLW